MVKDEVKSWIHQLLLQPGDLLEQLRTDDLITDSSKSKIITFCIIFPLWALWHKLNQIIIYKWWFVIIKSHVRVILPYFMFFVTCNIDKCLKKMNCELMLTYDTPALRQTGSRNLTGQKTLPTIWGTYMKLMTKYQISVINSCWEKCDEKCAHMFNVYKNQLHVSRQTGSRNLTGQKTLPTIWGTYMKLVTKYQISAINSCWEKCTEKWAYMFNVYKNQQSRQTGSRNLMGPKMLPTIWYTYMTAINSYWEKCDEKYLGWMEGCVVRKKNSERNKKP
jgi:hypothetical protein